MYKLTDDNTAAALAKNIKVLQEKGMAVDIEHLRYVKLNRLEQEEERKIKCVVNYDPDEWYD